MSNLLILLTLFIVGASSSAKASDPVKLEVKETVLGKTGHVRNASYYPSPDARHCAWIEQDDGRSWVVVDGKKQNVYDDVAEWTTPWSSGGDCLIGPRLQGFAWSKDSHHASYVGKRGGRLFAVVDGRESAGFTGVYEGAFSADGRHFGFVAQDGKKWRAVVDGIAGECYDWVNPILFSPVGFRYSYFGWRGKARTLVVDGVEVVTPDELGLSLAWSPDGCHYAIARREGGDWRMLLDGKPGPECEPGADPVFGPSGRTLCFAVPADTKKVALSLNGTRQQSFHGVLGCSVAFSPDGRHLAYVARNGVDNDLGKGDWLVVVDGVAHAALPYCNILAVLADGEVVWQGANEHRWSVNVRGTRSWEYDIIEETVWSPDGSHYGVVAKREGLPQTPDVGAGRAPGEPEAPTSPSYPWSFAVVDGVQGPDYGEVRDLAISPRGRRYAYVARKDGKWRLVRDGKEGPPYEIVTIPVFTTDGKHVVYETVGDSECRLWVDDTKVGEYLFPFNCSTAILDKAKVTMDGPGRFHCLRLGKDGVLLLEVTIRD